jgi:hypothetical protein
LTEEKTPASSACCQTLSCRRCRIPCAAHNGTRRVVWSHVSEIAQARTSATASGRFSVMLRTLRIVLHLRGNDESDGLALVEFTQTHAWSRPRVVRPAPGLARAYYRAKEGLERRAKVGGLELYIESALLSYLKYGKPASI